MTQDVLIFDPLMIQFYGGTREDNSATITLENNGKTLKLVGNGGKKVNFSYTITPDTILEFDYKSSQEGEIHGIGFDIDNQISFESFFQLYGTQNAGINDFNNYENSTGDSGTHYRIPVGDFFTGEVSYLTFINEQYASQTGAESVFSNIQIYEHHPPVESYLPIAPQILENTNIVENGSFTTMSGDDIFNLTSGTTYSTDAGKGWMIPNKHKWSFDGTNQWATTDNAGAGGLIQVIKDDQITQGLHAISFDATNLGSNNQLSLQVYGINGEFKIGHWKLNAPESLDGSPINVVNLLDTNNIADGEFNWKTFSWDSVDFGNGYEYIALRFWTNGVDGTEFQAIDNVAINSLATNIAPLAVDDSFLTQQNTDIILLAADLLSNDSDANDDSLSLISVNNELNGSVSLDSNGDIVFTPDIDFSGIASFDYTISDGNGGMSTATVEVEVEEPVPGNTNIVKDGKFISNNGEDIFSTSGTTGSADAGKGWIVSKDHKWNFDGINEWADTDNIGMESLNQVIQDNQMTQGLQAISFDVTNWGFDNTLKLQVYGINGDFQMKNWKLEAPESLDGSPIDVVTLLDTNNVIDGQFDWKTFSWDSVDFGSGYEYIALKFWTDGVDETEFQAIDNVIVGSVPENPKSPPKAYGDHFVTQKNNPLTILGSDLLANDVDPNGQIIQITEVTDASHGTVSLDSQGNIFFTPNADFAGITSFDYTIQNQQGSFDRATVTINVANDVALGTNLHVIKDWSTQIPFLDRFKYSREWITQTGQTWNTREDHLLDLDENGWVKSLPTPEDGVEYTRVSTILGQIDPGRYLVLYEGQGEINYKKGNIDEAESVDGRHVVDVVDGGFEIRITETDPNQTGDYIRNIHLIPEAYESTYETQTFNPTFLEKTEPYGAVRFMDWMKTNHSTQGEWSERPTLDSSTWSTDSGVPLEVMVELANTLDIDPWFTLPHLATDEYVTNFATYVRDNLEPERTVYVEYSNEVWNGQFEQANWVIEQAENDPDFNGNRMHWFGKRTTEITQIWDQVFEETGDKERVIGVMGAQASLRWTAEQALDYEPWSTENKTHADYGIDAIAIAPYFGGYIGKPEYEAEVETWTVDQLFDELTNGGLLNDGPTGGALQQAYDEIADYAELAQREGLQLLAYEGGQHLAGRKGVENNQAITDLFIEANRDPRMGELYEDYFTYWYQQGGGLFMHYTDIGTPRKHGSWGALESLDQASSPKYDALMDLINNGIETGQ